LKIFKTITRNDAKPILSYPIPNLQGEDLELTLVIKNSQFIANLRHTDGRSECDVHLNDMRRKYPDASHHCWAVVAAAPKDSTHYGLSDAGEPSGTAGKPMLQVLSHCGIGEVSVVVCRYFGGTKLGTGGLVKAYSDAAKLVVEACPTTLKRELSQITLTCPYDQSGRVERLCQKHDAEVKERSYANDLTLALTIPTNKIGELIIDLGPMPEVELLQPST
jgi:uncharacterized YigZ family protein